jgi:hypothetical protein
MSTKSNAPAKVKSAAKPPKGKKAADPVVTTPVAETPAAPAAVEAPKPAPVPKNQRNGITRPKAGTICAGIWDVCESMKAVGQDTTFEEIKKALPKVNDATIRTQRQRWKTYNG